MIETIHRKLNAQEIKALKKLKTKTEKDLSTKNKNHYFFIAAVLGSGSLYLASKITINILVFIFGTLGVILLAFVIFVPYELYKDRKKYKRRIHEIDKFLVKNNLEITPVKAIKIAMAKEYEDEGDLYIIEYEPDKILYLWDFDQHLKQKFPCLEFDLYEKDFCDLIGKQVFPLSNKVTPITIDSRNKWNYMKKFGVPGHRQIVQRNFDQLVEHFNGIS